MNQLDTFKHILIKMIKNHIPMQTVWGEVQSVNWEAKTCVVIGISDELPYYNVLLGLGGLAVRPKAGTICLMGLIENNQTTPFLIMTDELEVFDLVVQNSTLQIDASGFLMQKENETLKKLMMDLLAAIKNMVFTTSQGPTTQLINEPEFTALENRFKAFLK